MLDRSCSICTLDLITLAWKHYECKAYQMKYFVKIHINKNHVLHSNILWVFFFLMSNAARLSSQDKQERQLFQQIPQKSTSVFAEVTKITSSNYSMTLVHWEKRRMSGDVSVEPHREVIGWMDEAYLQLTIQTGFFLTVTTISVEP